MDDVTLPPFFEDTTPAEALKTMPRRKINPSSSDDDQERLVSRTQAAQNYSSIIPRLQSSHERQHEDDNGSQGHESETEHDETKRPWFGKRLWDAWWEWDREHLELVLENKQSVARDHLGNY